MWGGSVIPPATLWSLPFYVTNYDSISDQPEHNFFNQLASVDNFARSFRIVRHHAENARLADNRSAAVHRQGSDID